MITQIKTKRMHCAVGVMWAMAMHHSTHAAEEPIIDEITIHATGQETGVDSVLFEKEADQYILIKSTDLLESGIYSSSDLRRLDPRIVTTKNRGRGRSDGIQLRGLGGARIQVTLDEVPMGDALGDLVDLSMLNGLLIDFGSGSSRNGSGSLAGSVAFQTLRPENIIPDGEKAALQTLIFTSSLDKSAGTNLRYAQENDQRAYLGALSIQQKHEREPVGEAASWPQDILNVSALMKYEWKHPAGSSTAVTVDGFSETVETIIQDAYLFQDNADDQRERLRVSLNHNTFNADNSTRSKAHVYAQHIETVEETTQLDFGNQETGFDRRRISSNEFEQTLLGTQYQRRFLWGDRQRLYLGGDALLTQSRDLQESRTEILSSNTTFLTDPTRSFPISDGLSGGVYAESQYDYGDDHEWTLGVGLRYDLYVLDVTIDEAYEESLAGVNAPVDLNDGALTGRVTLNRRINDERAIYIKMSQGYRNGRFDEANQAFTNFANGYTVSPNPELSEETSLGFEFGYKSELLSGSTHELVAHYTFYDDFISEAFVGTIPNTTGIGPFANLAQFQAVNQDEVEIYGIDILARHVYENDIYLRYALAWIEGEDRQTHEKIDELQPLSGQIACGYQSPTKKWNAEVSMRFATEKGDVERVDAFVPDTWHALDVSCTWRWSERIRCDVSIENIFNTIYWEWSDVGTLNESNTQADKDFYAASVRHVKASLLYTW